MNLRFSLCNKCRTVDHKFLVLELRRIYPNASFEVRCQSYCGPGSINPFVAVNEVFISASNNQELLKKVCEHVEVNYVK